MKDRELDDRTRREDGWKPRLLGRYKWAFSFAPESETALDIGSSISSLLWHLREKADRVVAIDVDLLSLTELSSVRAPVLPVQASSRALPIRSGSVDTVFLLDVLEHVDDERATIDEIDRVLRPNGKMILSVPNKGSFQFLDPQNLRLRVNGRLNDKFRHRHYSLAELVKVLSPRFRIIRCHYGGLFLYPLMFAFDNSIRKHLRRDWGWFFHRVADLDNDISWGRLSYNIMLLVQKIPGEGGDA
jgi:SAM-dependent methyltransferase